MAVAFDQVTSQVSAEDASSLTIPAMAPAGVDQYSTVFVALTAGDLVNTVVKGGGGAGRDFVLIRADDDASGFWRIEQWELIAPNTTSETVVVTLNAAPGSPFWSAGWINLTGVDQTTPQQGTAIATGNNADPTVTITSATDHMVVSAVAFDVAVSSSADAPATERWEHSILGDPVSGTGATEAGAASVTADYTLTGAVDWFLSALSINDAAAAVSLAYLHRLPRLGILQR